MQVFPSTFLRSKEPVVRHSLSRPLAALLVIAVAILQAAPAPPAVPAGTKATASFGTEADGRPEFLIDGDPKTWMRGQANTCKDALEPVWIDLVFPAPVADLAGIETGDSDPYHNYYPKRAQFWVDTDGNGTFDTLGAEAVLGPAAQAAGRHLFGGRVPQAHGLRFLVTEQNRTGLNRCFTMNELRLIVDPEAVPLTTTPERGVEEAIRETAAAREVAAKAAADERRRRAPGPGESIVPGSENLPGHAIALPEGTRIAASFRTERDRGPEVLFDGDPETYMAGAGGSCTRRDQQLMVTLRFPAPVRNLAGIETGSSCPYHNYYPIELEFRVDSNNDGRFDTLLGRTRKLGPADRCIGRHLFDGRLEQAYGLEIRSVEQNTAGGNRAWTMNEMRLVVSDELPLATATPNSYRVLTYVDPLPAGTTARATVACEDGKGPALLLDNDPTTFMNPRPGTAREGVPVSVFLIFPAPVANLAGLRIGRSDPNRNYVWETMEIRADTTGDGASDLLAGTFTGGGEGVKRFRAPLPTVYGLELRVTRQTLRGIHRAFMLDEVDGLVFVDDPGDSAMRFVVEDFEDLSSWRVWAENTAQPEGERYYGGYTFVCGILSPEARSGQAVGQLRYCFKAPRPNADNWLRAKRGSVTMHEAIIDGIEFDANPQGYPCRISFEAIDARGRKVHTPRVDLSGEEWQRHRIDLSAAAWPQAATLTPPMKIEHLFLHSRQGGTGDVLLDNIAVLGTVSRQRRVTIKPVWEGLAYDPAKPLVVKYLLRNALDRPVSAPLGARLYSSFDPARTRALAEREVAATIPAWGETVAEVDFGMVGYGHYEAELALDAPGVAARHTDFLGVLTLNGGRINQTPMWIGSMHPGSWISDSENKFVLDRAIVPLGLDCYRTGSPKGAQRLIDAGLLLAAGAGGGLPKRLQKDGVPRPDVNEPNDHESYAAYWREKAAREYAPFRDHVISVEYFNEPDLPGFEFMPEIDAYLRMWRTWAGAMREAAPGIRLGTGSCTVHHGKAKEGFNRRMYTELAREADVAVWHAHGPLSNYISRHRQVETWLREGGRPGEEMLLGNSEAGAVSRNSAAERLAQADTLVKKIGWAKSQADSLFYIWFTTTDTFDPQGGYLDGENWGLISHNQRLKPSGQAMNEIIRQLADTEGLGETTLDRRLRTCVFRTADGGRLWLFWPHETGARFLQNLAASGPVELSDMFGATRTLEPVAGRVSFLVNGYPMYLRAGPGVTVGAAATPAWLAVPELVSVVPGGQVAIRIAIADAWGAATRVPIAVENIEGIVVGRAEAQVPEGGRCEALVAFDLPAGLTAGSVGYVVRLRDPEGGAEIVVPLTVAVGQLVPRADTPLVADGRPARPAASCRIVLDGIEAVHDLVDDPQTPKWAGPEDLSATAHIAHDGQGLYLRFDVRDQAHHPGEPGEHLWTGDSVQVGIAAQGRQTEVGFTEAGGGSGWCWISPDSARVGHWLEPIVVRREGNTTFYECYLPFEALGFEVRPGMLIRLAFAVNEDDGRGRVRLLKWFDGIHPLKDADLFGYLILE
jgi:hypothetical protein